MKVRADGSPGYKGLRTGEMMFFADGKGYRIDVEMVGNKKTPVIYQTTVKDLKPTQEATWTKMVKPESGDVKKARADNQAAINAQQKVIDKIRADGKDKVKIMNNLSDSPEITEANKRMSELITERDRLNNGSN
jgi:hypothetical protein